MKSDRFTIRDVNKALTEFGYDERLVSGGNYFYFVGGSSDNWEETGVYVCHITDLSISQWIDECSEKHAKYD